MYRVYCSCTVSELETDFWGIAEVTGGSRLCFGNLSSLCCFFFAAQHPSSGLGRLIFDVSKSYTDTPHWVGFLWTRDRPFADNTQLLQETEFHALGGIRIRNSSKREASDQPVRPRCHRINQPLGQANEYPRDGMSLQYLVFILIRIFGFITSSWFYSVTVITYAVLLP